MLNSLSVVYYLNSAVPLFFFFTFLLIIMSDHEDVDALFEDDPGPLEEVIDEDDAEDLKLDQAENKVWLVKVKIRQ